MSPMERYRYVRTLRMPLIPKAVLWCILSHSDKDGCCWPSRTLLAAEAGISSGSTYNALRWLANHGLMIQYRRPGRSTTIMLTLDAFRSAAAATPSPHDAPPRHHMTTEVVQGKGRAPRRIAKLDNLSSIGPRCWCGNTSSNPKGGACPIHLNTVPFPGSKRALKRPLKPNPTQP
jgi:hypothetical protein